MQRMTIVAVAMVAMMVAARTGADAGQEPQPPTPQTNPAEFTRVAEDAIERVCASCHGWDVIGGARRTTAEWDKVLSDMVAQGARGTTAEMALIRGYVLWSYGRVAVNSASAEELTAVLGIQAATAKAIVDYRAEHGAFRNADDLAKVPGLDRQVLAAQAAALQFETTHQRMR